MVKKLSLAALLLTLVYYVSAQDVLLEKDLNESVYLKKKGPNKEHFVHLYYDFASFLNSSQKGNVYDGDRSFRTYIGLRSYYKLTNAYIMGFEGEFGWETFRIRQSSDKIFPSSGTHTKEILNTSNIGLAYFNRILFTQRESSLGVWLDGGIYGNLSLSSRHVTKDKASSSDDVRYHKTVDKGLKYLNPWEYGIKARLGYRRYAATFTYRLSDWVSGKVPENEPPRVSLGLELGIY